MHKLLLRQLKRSLQTAEILPDEIKSLLTSVDEAYEQADTDRLLLENALELTSQELLERNQELQRDIAERKKMAEALRQSEERYRHLVEQSPDGIVIHQRGKILFINPAGVKLLAGESPAQIMEKTLLEYVHPDYREKVIARIRAMQDGAGHAPLLEEKFIRLDGAVFDTEVQALPFMLDQEQAFQVIFRDITARKKAVEERLTMERKLQETQRLESLGVLAGGIAHDFNNLLVAILGNADLAMLELGPNAPVRTSIEKIVVACQRAADLTRQMLAYSGKARFVIQAVDLHGLVNEMLGLMRAAVPKNVSIQISQVMGLPLIEADATQLRQVVMNLLINAADAIGEQDGTITVSTRVRKVDAAYLSDCYLVPDQFAPEYVALEVADTGEGMDQMTISRIFEPFYTTKFIGRGLGLATMLGIVKAHHGAIKVKSMVGKGTTFTILFPVCPLPVEEEPPAPVNLEVFGHGTVLVIDDEDEVRQIATRMLEREGFTVLTASNGEAGIEHFQGEGPIISCVLLDLSMPRMSGEETFHILRKIQPGLPVVLMSGYSSVELKERFQDEPHLTFLAKPFSSMGLSAAIQQVLQKDDSLSYGAGR